MEDKKKKGSGWELLSRFRVRDLMTEKLVTLSVADQLRLWDENEAWRRLRHIPVVDSAGKLVGMVSHRDLMNKTASALLRPNQRAHFEQGFSIPVVEAMRKDVVTISPDAGLIEAAHLMFDNEFGALPVVDIQGALLGIITEADFVELVHFGEDCFK
ncbi:MAG: CBS domain-containing protein [Bradymonadales bacterium]|nr:MAG: CBS domain-containing protein [Bradymonadales bacterium]